jgi:hypothetical protein
MTGAGGLLVALAGVAFADGADVHPTGVSGLDLRRQHPSSPGPERRHRADQPQGPEPADLLRAFPRRRLLQAMDVPGVRGGHGLYVNTLTWKNPDTRREMRPSNCSASIPMPGCSTCPESERPAADAQASRHGVVRIAARAALTERPSRHWNGARP